MSTRWADSADKHGIDRADTLHAMRSPKVYLPDFDRARVEGGSTVDLFIGPTRDDTLMLEVLAHVDAANWNVLIFHVMPLRRSTLERAQRVLTERRKQQ